MSEQDTDLSKMRAILERIQTMHWDMAACQCWVCTAAREAGCRPREKYLKWCGTWDYVKVGGDG